MSEEQKVDVTPVTEEGASMEDYATELEASFKEIVEGEIMTGVVIAVGDEDVTVDLKYYTEGIIPLDKFSREPGYSLKEHVAAGDEISAAVVKKDDGQGHILLSKIEADDELAWDKLRPVSYTHLDVYKRQRVGS